MFYKLFKYAVLISLALGSGLIQTTAVADIGDNIALVSNGGNASQSSYLRVEWPASRCIDNVTTGYTNYVICHTSGNALNEWWDLELANNKSIDSIVIYNRTSCCSARILNIFVLVSDTPFPSGSDAASLTAARAQASFEYQITADVPVTTINLNNHHGQYVRLQKGGAGLNIVSNSINLIEVQVFEGGGIVDLAVSKSVSEMNPNVGDIVNFELVVTNHGPDDAFDVTVADAIPDGFGSVSNISDAGALDAGGSINWTIENIPNGDSQTLTYNALVIAP